MHAPFLRPLLVLCITSHIEYMAVSYYLRPPQPHMRHRGESRPLPYPSQGIAVSNARLGSCWEHEWLRIESQPGHGIPPQTLPPVSQPARPAMIQCPVTGGARRTTPFRPSRQKGRAEAGRQAPFHSIPQRCIVAASASAAAAAKASNTLDLRFG